MDYPETRKKWIRHEATRHDRATIKSSMTAYRAQQGIAVNDMRTAQLEAGRQAAQKKQQKIEQPKADLKTDPKAGQKVDPKTKPR